MRRSAEKGLAMPSRLASNLRALVEAPIPSWPQPLGRRSLLAVVALAACLWLCLGGAASAATPSNDDFANAAALSGLPVSTTGTNVDATSEPGEPGHASGAAYNSVWWSWTAPSDGDVTVDTCGSDFGARLTVYTGSSVDALTPVGGDDNAIDNCDDDTERKWSFTAHSGQVYKIAVDGTPDPTSGTGNVVLALYKTPQPANDEFANATELTLAEDGFPPVVGTNAGASKESGEPNHAGDTGGRSVWWRWTAPRSGVVYLDTGCRDDLNTLLAVYIGNSIGALTTVASNDDSCHKGSSVSFRARAGQTYRIAVDGAGEAIGTFFLSYKRAPPNDDFENAMPLSGLSAADGASNDSATSEPGEPDHAGNASGHSLWWHWTAPANGSVQVAARGGGPSPFALDTVLGVYTGSAVGALSTVASNDDAPVFAPWSAVAFRARAGRTYSIAVDMAAGASVLSGTFDISLRETPAPASPPPGGDAPAAGGASTANAPLPGACANAKTGGPGPDRLTGSAFGDTLRGLAGKDTLLGLAGDDCLSGAARQRQAVGPQRQGQALGA